MNREVDRQAERQRGQDRHRHVVVLADEADEPVGEHDRDRERHHREHAVDGRAEENHHHQEDDDEGAHEALEHPADHFLLPNDVDVGEAGPLRLKSLGWWIRGEVLVHVRLDGEHVLVVTALELHPDRALAIVRAHEVPQVVGAM